MPVKTDVIFDAIESAAYTAHLEETVERLSRELDQSDLLVSYLEYEKVEAEKHFLRLTSSLQTIDELENQLYLEAEHTAALESLLRASEDKQESLSQENKKLSQEIDDLYENIDENTLALDLDSFVFGLFAGVSLFGAMALFMV